MRDAQGRRIGYLRLSVTDRCNCRCAYCMPADGVPMLSHDDVCSFEELARITGACCELGVSKVRLTGGEPLVRRGLPGLVRMLRAVPGVRELAMTTNATLLAPVAAELRAAGLDRLNVSLDSLRPERYAAITRGARLDDALAGLQDFCGFGNGGKRRLCRTGVFIRGPCSFRDVVGLCKFRLYIPKGKLTAIGQYGILIILISHNSPPQKIIPYGIFVPKIPYGENSFKHICESCEYFQKRCANAANSQNN